MNASEILTGDPDLFRRPAVLPIRERQALLPDWPLSRLYAAGAWLTGDLAATQGARERIQGWAAAGAPDGDPGRFFVIGARRDLVRAVVQRLPACVVSTLAPCVSIIGLGGSIGGLTTSHDVPALPVGRMLVGFLVEGSDDDIQATIAHELAHAWTSDVRLSTGRDQVAHALAQPEATVEDLAAAGVDASADAARRSERRATRLAWQWGFRGRAADERRIHSQLGRLVLASV